MSQSHTLGLIASKTRLGNVLSQTWNQILSDEGYDVRDFAMVPLGLYTEEATAVSGLVVACLNIRGYEGWDTGIIRAVNAAAAAERPIFSQWPIDGPMAVEYVRDTAAEGTTTRPITVTERTTFKGQVSQQAEIVVFNNDPTIIENRLGE